METDQVAVMLGDCCRLIVAPEFAGHATHRGKSVDMVTHEGLEVPAVGKLDVEFATMALDQAEGIELTGMTLVGEGTEMVPVDFKALAHGRLHAYKGTLGRSLGADGVQMLLKMLRPPSKPSGRSRSAITTAQAVGSWASHSAIVGLKGSSLLARCRVGRVSAGRSKCLARVWRPMCKCRAILRATNARSQATPLVPLALPLPVGFHDLGVLAAALFLVAGMFVPPLKSARLASTSVMWPSISPVRWTMPRRRDDEAMVFHRQMLGIRHAA